MEYCIVETYDKKKDVLQIQAVPTIWVNNEILQWPKKNSNEKIKKYISPKVDWEKYECKVLYSKISK